MSQTPVHRGLILLAMAWPDRSADGWAGASIGERDGRLLGLREELFGPLLEGTAICPECGERLEVKFSTHDVRVQMPALPPFRGDLRVGGAGGYEVQYRLPTSTDLLEAAKPSTADGRETLLKRCVQSVKRDGAAVDLAALPDEIMNSVTEAMAAADPQADVQVALTCPTCQHRWSMAFDILSYLWSEIDDWAQRLLREVHALASSYGWSERDILAMSAGRRRLYLELIGA